VASESDLNKRVYFLNATSLKLLSHSEEHLVVDAGPLHSYKVGDVFFGLPFHICPTIALYDHAYVIENGDLTSEWEIIARKRKIEC
jgi:D-serine deaminase-like pyridoxal phosphate-dependent protein